MINENSVHLRIEFDDGTHKFFTCEGDRHNKGRIDDVFSYRHATKSGWRFANHNHAPGEYAAFCPECAKKLIH
jgi:hypothetical protein